MKKSVQITLMILSLLSLIPSFAKGDAAVMNPGEAVGQLVFLSEQDVLGESEKFKSLSPISIPVFAELPMDLSVVSGAITLKQQNLLSHVQLKSRARGTPNLDISALEGGLQNPLLANFKDGDFVRMLLGKDGSILIEPSTEKDATDFYAKKHSEPVKLEFDLSAKDLFKTQDIGWQDYVRVGSKAANYAELAKVLNSPDRTVVRPGFALPFYYYQQFIDSNPNIKTAIEKVLKDPLMNKLAKVSYRNEKLENIRNMILDDNSVVSQDLVNLLIDSFDTIKDNEGMVRKMKLRSSTNSEDLPNFNGAGLYTSDGYKPYKDGKELSRDKKEKKIKETLRNVWASVWNLRAWDERTFFGIPHGDVKMGMQINPSFEKEGVDGVVVTKNISKDPNFTMDGVYIEAQRGDKYSVANPEPGTKPAKILVEFNRSNALDKTQYKVHVIQFSNIADDGETKLPSDNPNPIMTDEELMDLAFQCLKAEAHFKPIFGAEKADFALDMEFKVDSKDNNARTVFLKQARPYID